MAPPRRKRASISLGLGSLVLDTSDSPDAELEELTNEVKATSYFGCNFTVLGGA